MTPAISRDAAAGAGSPESREKNCDLPQLAARLFDLRAVLEREMRTLTWVQCSLEGIRAGHACGDHDLLLREIARLFGESATGVATIAAYRDEAMAMLTTIIAERDRTSAQPRPLAIVA
jgi:hypothetical protein